MSHVGGTLAAAGSFTLPANAFVTDILVVNRTASAITGGLKFGTTSGAADIVAALAVAANAKTFVPDSQLLKAFFSQTASQAIFITAVTAWNGATVDIFVIYYQL